jgi:hypothetical protein
LVIPIWWTNELVRWDRQQQHGGFKKQNKIWLHQDSIP